MEDEVFESFSTVQVAPTTDPTLRRQVIQRLLECGLKSLFRNIDLIGDNWAALSRINIDRWDPEEGPNIDKLLPKVRAVLERRAKELAGVPEALQPIITAWKNQHTEKVATAV